MTPPNPPPPRASIRAKLDNLQILRAVAAASVVVLHAFHETEALGRAPLAGGRFAFGVDIFFVLSGFIMAHTTAREFGAAGASLRFLRRRLARVVPLYWLLTTVMLIGAAAAPSLLNVPIGDLFHVVASYLFIPDGRGAGEMRPVMALGWTLNYEMLFYAMFSVALLTPLRFGIAWLSALMVALAISHNIVEPSHARMAFWTDPIILEFLFGVYVALAMCAGWRLGLLPALALYALGALGFASLGSPLDDVAPFLRNGVPAALLVAAAALGPAAPERRLTLWAVALGDASYSLYLAHPFVLRPARAVWTKLVGAHLPAIAFVPLAVAGAVVVALLLYRFVERPLTAQAQRLGAEPKAARAPAHEAPEVA